MKKLSASSRLTIFLAVVLTIAFLICFLWDLMVLTPYHWYIKDFENIFGESLYYDYEQRINGYLCRASIPTPLANNGFLCIKTGDNIVSIDSDGRITPPSVPDITIWIWPSVFEEPIYMIDIGYLINDRTESTSDASYIKYEKKADGTYEIEHELEAPEALKIFNENRDMIEDMLDCMDEIWSFNGYEDIKKGLECKNESD